MEFFSDRIHSKEAPLDNCWGFVDGTVGPVCRPGYNQKIIYHGHKYIHALKPQSIVASIGLAAGLFSAVEHCRQNSAVLAITQIYPQQFLWDQNGALMCMYNDPVYFHWTQHPTSGSL